MLWLLSPDYLDCCSISFPILPCLSSCITRLVSSKNNFCKTVLLGALYFTPPRDPSRPIHPLISPRFYISLWQIILNFDIPPSFEASTEIKTAMRAEKQILENWNSFKSSFNFFTFCWHCFGLWTNIIVETYGFHLLILPKEERMKGFPYKRLQT